MFSVGVCLRVCVSLSSGSAVDRGEFVSTFSFTVNQWTAFTIYTLGCCFCVNVVCVACVLSSLQLWHVYWRTTQKSKDLSQSLWNINYKCVNTKTHTHTYTHTPLCMHMLHTQFEKPQKCTWQCAIFCNKCLPHPCICQYKLFQQIFPDVDFAVIALRCMASRYYWCCWKASNIFK